VKKGGGTDFGCWEGVFQVGWFGLYSECMLDSLDTLDMLVLHYTFEF
jgi:hypothetical protein